MDKKNLVIGLAFILAAFGVIFYQSTQVTPPPAVKEQVPAGETSERSAPSREDSEASSFMAVEEEKARSATSAEADASLFRPADEVESVEETEPEGRPDLRETIRTLANDYIEVDFTTRGGAIREIRFLRTLRDGPDTFVFNTDSRIPALGLSLRGPRSEASFTENYNIDETATSSARIVFKRQLGEGIEIRRSFALRETGEADADPYRISHHTELINRTERALSSNTGAFLNLGTVYQIREDNRGEFLNFGYYDGDAEFLPIKRFIGSNGFMGFGSSLPVESIQEDVPQILWGTVKNQFFAFVASVGEGQPSQGFFARAVRVTPPPDSNLGTVDAIEGSLEFPLDRIEPGDTLSLRMDFFAGPKEFRRLAQLGENQEEVMQFGFFGFFSKILLSFMYLIHTVVPSWGWSIVVMTVIIKTLFWPLTAKAAQSQKRMQKIQAPMKELREKYKDNPQKMQKETMKLFRENKVNPAAGCLPIIIQIPIFIGLFWMLRTASELRYAPFLWINDLSRPDTVAEVFGFPINILPLIMGATMFFQMQMTPSMATADPMQQKIFKLLPVVFLIFLYNFSSGLVLYWTVQNLLTILQQYITNKRSDVANEPVVVPGSPKAKKKGTRKGGGGGPSGSSSKS